MPYSSVLLRTFNSLKIVSSRLNPLLRRQIRQLTLNQKNNEVIKGRKQIFLIDCKDKWEEISTMVCRDIAAVNVVGFDCEWVHANCKRKPVALAQLATYSGQCILVRLNYLQRDLPSTLRDILEDRKIIKAGVNCGMDASYLAQDYNINVRGWMDLRHLAVEDNFQNYSFSLKSLAEHYLGKTLNKDVKIKLSDWEAQTLTQQQVIYAAEDALVGVHILLVQLKSCWENFPISQLFPPATFPANWEASSRKIINEICEPYVEVDFHRGSFRLNSKSENQTRSATQISDRISYDTRRSPLYENSQLLAPDGELLCRCTSKNALWYVEKGLGDLVSEEPLVIKLRFEPARRYSREGFDGQFYLQERCNSCVVCGEEDFCSSKSIIPHEYRKYFPKILKYYNSHDKVLLCTRCSKRCDFQYHHLKKKLSKKCDRIKIDVKLSIDGKLKSVKSAGETLKESKYLLPPKQIHYLENKLKKYFKTDTLTEDHITQGVEYITHILNEECSLYSFKVFKQYEKIGLISLEARWRQWFLDTMKPKYMPKYWSVLHKYERLKLELARYPLDAKIREAYKVFLVGTDGDINIINQPNCLDSDSSLSEDSSSKILFQNDQTSDNEKLFTILC